MTETPFISIDELLIRIRMRSFVHHIKSLIKSSRDERSRIANYNIVLCFGNKFVAIILSLVIVPISIDYLDVEQYGIWLTLSSVVTWLSFFDVGLGHGFRNRFTEAKAKNDDELAKKYVSTTFFMMLLFFGMVLLVSEFITPYINWSSLLHLSQANNIQLSSVVSIVLVGVCFSFVVNVASIMLSADQQPAKSALITTAGQGLALFIILILTRLPKHDIRFIAYALSWSPIFITLIASIWIFTHGYKKYAPSYRYVDKTLIKKIMNLGVKFFVIQVSMILIFQVVNVILSRTLGPSAVTEYNVAYKYYSLTMMVFNVILTPYWSAFTDAYTKGDLLWMRTIHKKLHCVWGGLLIASLLLLVFSPIVFKIWIGDTIKVSYVTSIFMFVYINILSYSSMYMILLNGVGKVFLQMIVYIVCASVSIPLSVLLCKTIGVAGILIVLSSVYFIQAIISRIQFERIITNTSTGIWNQ